MKLKEIKFSDEEKVLIEKIVNKKGFCGDSWSSDDEVKILSERIKEHYHEQQNTVCPYCRMKFSTEHGRYWDIEHIMPRSLHPTFMFEPKNLCMSCVPCNTAKKAKKVSNSTAKKKYPNKSELFFIFHPHFDEYEKHINVIEEGLFYMPTKSTKDFKSKGSKTIEICGLYRFFQFAGFGDCDVDMHAKIDRLNKYAEMETDPELKRDLIKQICAITIKALS
ncbi:HNH endonuclease [Vibrio parahaemolyticus]|uniref:HNH endonuclease n=1 Tax=Vibrio parahaemolyticus TaxID=670 RepID=UPI000A6CB1B8|nr:HNH endonuclease [Vibrio parahaemolyticus]EGQ8084499.1 HNH endonuclease [Vibrio parahaemolyticus]EGQ8138108.1 HNH endonuclease [Vibrio parahaemolyticus]EGQ8146979.1 HNH endonuclease [Vibrio parahaemolyticus]EGQ8254270.1 HNH endonuclease [Vibrio parahaemolyticus]EGQ8263653.1 HNH endonuclease [Vibrio parahaemolyticus]